MTEYTSAQREAIGCLDRNLQIIACAGSGKTQVIAQRIADILARPGVTPKNIVAFTFTEKAASELRERVLSIIGEQEGVPIGLAEMFIGTMHAYCLNLLQTYVPETFKFSVLSDVTQRLLIDRNSKRSGLTETPTTSSAIPFLQRYIHSRLYAQVLSVLAEDDVDLSQVNLRVLMAQQEYKKLLAKTAYFDFTTMLELAVELLEANDADQPASTLLHHIRDDVRFVVVDEYQDVNPLQERLVRAMTKYGANLCVVGDDDQTIYQWRGSTVSNIVTFSERYQNVQQVTLADNFRSSQGVVALGQMVAETIAPEHRLVKRMQHASHQEWKRDDILVQNFGSPEEEANWTCDQIQYLRGVAFTDSPGKKARGLSWSDMAVLFRSVSADAGPLVKELDRRGIPYVVKGLSRLFDAPEIKAVASMFRYIVGDISSIDLEAAWRDSRLALEDASLEPLIGVLNEASDFSRGTRWGVYNIQRVYLEALEALGVREDTVPGDKSRGELAFYQLGKFSQVISDFETVHFSSAPEQKYRQFVDWLKYQAPAYYDEADGDIGYATPDAVTLSTVHRAKGMQWPAVFVPCLRRNRFPSKRHGGLGVFHIIPEDAIDGADRYKGTTEDERRLFYVAVTRAQKFLYMSYSPGPSAMYRSPSEFVAEVSAVPFVSTSVSDLRTEVPRLEPQSKAAAHQITLSFSELKFLFECPYQFKLRFMYGFNAPIHEALGYGKGLHDALAEIHKRALHGDVATVLDVEGLIHRHLHTPYAYPTLREALEQSAKESVRRYLTLHSNDLMTTIYSEKKIQVNIAPGITVNGRIDLVQRLETDEVSIVDFKSTERSQDEDVTRDQLHVYAVGYAELTGERADLIEVLNLDARGKNVREDVSDELLKGVLDRIKTAGDSLRDNHLPKFEIWSPACNKCDLSALCRSSAEN
ncbi:ATP-dependent DNA helicase [Pseudarthrobacter sulfonivorans]|uniref:ATP-dependent helicase n=1 Tax=Pseudarthrobacter sulfonivorans TaxID=121292 RepID=UPI002865F5AD|nr:ATP-dependent DNA helicase [Pseudarthrobacter sulfonivorans]MDR6415579.1 DNA helicase-2/ATP-dependent DNA helicase PcrA [Pseudarthrobacter sulfonivorans]